jgi:integrase
MKHRAANTFATREDAEAWLYARRNEISEGAWTAGGAAKRKAVLTFETYAATWLDRRQLKPRTRSHYRNLLDAHIVPTFGDKPLTAISTELVVVWHTTLDAGTPTLRAHAYALLKAIMATAVADDLIAANPCRIRGASSARTAKKIKPASLEELATLVAAMPDRYRVMTLLAAWCGLRFGELIALRRRDVDLKSGVLHVDRGIARSDGEVHVGTPKSHAGTRDVAIPPHLMPAVKAHLAEHAEPGRDGLLFPARHGGYLAPGSLYRVFYPARAKAGRPDLRWHDLRHTGAVMAAATGATLAELMGRLGHSTPAAALRYQHAAAGRDAAIAKALSALATSADEPV